MTPQRNNSRFGISSSFSFLFKYAFPCLLLAFFGVGFYDAMKNEEIIFQFFCGFGFVYVSMISLLVLSRISVFVYLDKEDKSVVAYNNSNGKKKVERWSELVSVYNFLNIYTVLKFSSGTKIRFRPRKYIPLLEDEDAKDIIQLLKKLAIKNKIQQVA